LRIDIDEEEELDTDYDGGKKRASGVGIKYAAFNETRQKTQDSDPSIHLGS
jgi:hypothetical protein